MDSLAAWLEFPSSEKISLGELCSIGRSPYNQVVITSERVSRKHAVIRRNSDGAYELTDFGSSNGTYLDGHRIMIPTLLADGCVIEIGLQKITFRHPLAAPQSPEPSESGEAGEPAKPSETSTSQAWLLVADATERGCRTPAEGLLDKTREAWNERLQRIVRKYRGTAQRALNEGLLAYWFASEGSSASAASIATVLTSLRRSQMESEEFRFVLHYGEVSIRLNPNEARAPAGPEVIFVMELQRLAKSSDLPLLITETARQNLGDSFATRALSRSELRGYNGKHQFFTAP